MGGIKKIETRKEELNYSMKKMEEDQEERWRRKGGGFE